MCIAWGLSENEGRGCMEVNLQGVFALRSFFGNYA